jgi:hypothetical protein
MDGFGYTCQTVPASFVPGTTKLPISGYYGEAAAVTLPFPFRFYGKSYTTAYVATNGFLNFLAPDAHNWNWPLPDWAAPHAGIYPFWDHLNVDENAGVYTTVSGSAPNRQVVIEWRNVAFGLDETNSRVSFAVLLHENGQITMQYADIDAKERERGSLATVGIENETSFGAFQYSYRQPILNNMAIRFIPPVPNLLKNAGFELDNNYDSRPDSWSTNANFTHDFLDQEGRLGSISGTHRSTADANYTVRQAVGGIVAGQRYSFVGWVRIPGTSDRFSFTLHVQWRDAANVAIGTPQVIKTYTAPTAGAGWDEAASNALVAPTGATRAEIRMVVSSLNATIYVDDFIFGK